MRSIDLRAASGGAARSSSLDLAITVWIALLWVAVPGRVVADEQRAWTTAISDEATWNSYSKVIGSDQIGKFIIDLKSDKLYFIDVNLFNIHADFVLGVLQKKEWTTSNIREYNRNYERVKPQFILGYVTHHLKVDRWTMSFWEGDKIGPVDVIRARKRLDQGFFKANLPFRPDSPMQQKVAEDVAKQGFRIITNDEIYKAARYQAFNLGKAVGRLKVVPVGTPYEALTFERTDIVLLQESYPDITPVAGILATQFSTPLSHVNLRATAWGIPNAGDKKAREAYAKLDGKMVYFEVTETGMTLRPATAAEIRVHEGRVAAARRVDLPQADLTTARFAMLTRIRAKDVSKYGAKTANLGEIVTANLEGVRVPPGFGVPFLYYARHMQQHALDTRVAEIVADPRFARDAAWRKSTLEELRRAIVAAPIDAAVLDAIYKRVRLSLGGRGVFVRSSTNSEDLPGFNGAGLYDTVPNVVGKQALGEAIKTVWASLWNLRAVDERAAFGIDQRQVFASVLVQVGVDATAAGVLVTKNLYDRSDDRSYTINAKFGLGMRVVEGQKVPEQIIYDPGNDGTKILSRSDDPVMLKFDADGGIVSVPVPPGEGVILTETRAKALATQVQAILPLFRAGAFPNPPPLDVEWVLEGETMWIVQARPYVGGGGR